MASLTQPSVCEAFFWYDTHYKISVQTTRYISQVLGWSKRYKVNETILTQLTVTQKKGLAGLVSPKPFWYDIDLKVLCQRQLLSETYT